MDNSSQEPLFTDGSPLVVDGKAVAVDRSRYQAMIEQTARTDNLSAEEAWNRIKDHLAAALTEEGRRGRRSRPVHQLATEVRAVPGAPSSPSKTADVLTSPLTSGAASPGSLLREVRAPEVEVSTDGRVILRLNGSPVSAVRLDSLPARLRQSGKSLIEMLSLSMIVLEGEHPDAALLRMGTPSGIFDTGPVIDPARQHAINAIEQRQFQYPLQKATVRILPNDFSKTSLFHVASNNVPRRTCVDELLGTVGSSTRIEYRGMELRHDDELVFMQLLHVARGKRPFERLHFNISSFFRGSRGTGRILSVKDTDSVSQSLLRLRQAMLVVTNTQTGRFFTVNLIKDLEGTPTDQVALIDPVVVLLCSSFAAMNTDQLFSTSGVARQLLKYLSTVPSPIERLHPIKITNLFELCYGKIQSLQNHYREGNPDKPESKVKIAISKKVSDFRRTTLPSALCSLRENGVIVNFVIDPESDKVTITRNAAASVTSVEGPEQSDAT